MVKGDKCWIIENRYKITPVEIVSVSGNLVLMKTENGSALRLPKHRLYESEDKAKEVLNQYNPEQKQRSRTPYDYLH